MLAAIAALGLLCAGSPQTTVAEARLFRDGEQSVLQFREDTYRLTGDHIAWSPNGRRLLVYGKSGGPITLVHLASRTVREIASNGRRPQWARDSAKIAYEVPGGGLTVFDASLLSEPPRTVAKTFDSGSAAWGPDSDRLAYSAQGDLWLADVHGTAPRRILRNRSAAAMSWSPDGRWLAFAEPPLKGMAAPVWRVRPSGTGLTKLSSLALQGLSWSPNSKWLLAEQSAGWVVLGPSGTKPIPLDAKLPPIWVGSQKLLLMDATGWTTTTPDAAAKPERLGETIPYADLLDRAPTPYLEVTADLGKSPVSASAPRPARNEMVLQGYVESADPIEGHYIVHVNTVVEPSGRELTLADGSAQKVRLLDRPARRNGQLLPLPRSMDLRPDAELTLLVQGARLDAKRELPILGGWIEGDETAAVPPRRGGPRLQGRPVDYDGVSHEKVVVPMVFPVVGRCDWSDWFLAPRGGGTRRHHGQDLMAAKMTPLVAAFDGTVYVGRSSGVGGHNTLTIEGDNGWSVNYYHVNNDTPGTDDGRGTENFAFAPGLSSGQRVFAGQFVAFVGDSGNAESTAPHCHFELWDQVTHAVVNAAPSLRGATKLAQPLAQRLPAEVDVRPGEVRYDGIVREVDAVRGVVRTQLLSRTVRGKATAVLRSESLYVKVGKNTDCHLLGNENLPLAVDELRPGLYAVLVGPAGKPGAAISARRAAFGTQ